MWFENVRRERWRINKLRWRLELSLGLSNLFIWNQSDEWVNTRVIWTMNTAILGGNKVFDFISSLASSWGGPLPMRGKISLRIRTPTDDLFFMSTNMPEITETTHWTQFIFDFRLKNLSENGRKIDFLAWGRPTRRIYRRLTLSLSLASSNIENMKISCCYFSEFDERRIFENETSKKKTFLLIFFSRLSLPLFWCGEGDHTQQHI